MNPVTLVATVVVRKIAVQPSSCLPLRSPYSTTNPEPIPARLMITCSRVNVEVVMPRIMVRLLSGRKDALHCYGDTLIIQAFGHRRGLLSAASGTAEGQFASGGSARGIAHAPETFV